MTNTEKQDVYSRITSTIIASLEQGVRPWMKPWYAEHAAGRITRPAGKDAEGRSLYRAKRTRVTIEDVIAIAGPRVPDVDHSQREFNLGIVVVVEHGHTPTRELIEQANGIRRQWIQFWQNATGHRASMTVNPG